MAEYQAPPPKTGPFGWLLIAIRVLLWLLLLPPFVLLTKLARPFTRRRIFPQLYFKLFCLILGLPIKLRGHPVAGAIYLPNHISWMDTPALLAATGTAFVANDGLSKNKALKFLCDLNRTVFVARHQRATIARQVEDVRQALAQAGALTIFLEGTTTTGDRLLPFKSSLLSAVDPLPPGAAIQPVLLRYPEGADMSWVGDEPALHNVERMLARWRPKRLEITFLEPLSGPALADRKSMAAAAQAAVTEAMAHS